MTTTTPAGRPAWSRTAAIEDFGGHLQKANYQSQGVVNPRTDVGAEAIARMSADQVACSRTAGFFNASVLCNDTGSAPPTIEAVLMMTGVRATSYEGDDPPPGFPEGTRDGTGYVTLSFDATYTDEYGVEEAFTPRGVHITCEGAVFADAVYVISGQDVQVRVFDAAGSALGNRRFSIEVW